MKSSILNLAFLAIGATAAPTELGARSDLFNELVESSDLHARDTSSYGSSACLDATSAQQVATNFKNLITAYSVSLANATLTTGFTDYSDSVNELIDNGCPNGPIPLGNATFTSRAAFEAGQSGQPSIPFKQLDIWNTCRQVIIRWRSDQSPNIVTGIIVFDTIQAPFGSKYPDLIKKVYSEFNSGAWLYNLGIFKPTCN